MTEPSSPERSGARVQREFPCASCGAKLVFVPGTRELRCEFCGAANAIGGGAAASDGGAAGAQVAGARAEVAGAGAEGGGDGAGVIEELDYAAAVAEMERGAPADDAIVVHCGGCGAETPLKPNVTSQACPFCGSPIVATGQSRKLIRPRSVLPFEVSATKARELFTRWLAGLWFAPGDLKRAAGVEGKLSGLYLPYWTYDAKATTAYTGERGDDYFVTQMVTVMVNGRPQVRPQQVRRTRWTRVSGSVENAFDDVLIPASTSLPAEKLEGIGGFDLPALVPYADQYLAGFTAESYTVDVARGFEQARGVMEPTIRETVRRDIGGDHQRIGSMTPRFRGITFKHILAPVWVAAYRYRGTVYRFLINGRTGQVSGDRPYSAGKIALAIAAGVLVAGIVALVIAMSR